ncbi:MAG: GH92 family glycosyl hydrolase [bacterium]|jgi:predicted alpha-1,2-mannosidase
MLRILIYITVFIFWGLNSYAQKLTDYVNPFVGTDAHGHTFPGATTPFGMVQLSPDTRIDGSWDGCSGYHYSDSLIYGFSHTHLSGTGCSDYGDVAFMPGYAKAEDLDINNKTKPANMVAKFQHKNEKASVGFYEVLLNDIKVELTASTRAGMQRYTFLKDGIACISINLSHRDELLVGKLNKVNNTKYNGFRRSKAWAEDQLVYFSFESSKSPIHSRTFKSSDNKSDEVLILYFNVKKGEQISVKTGISSVDENNADLNLQKEIPHWNFDLIHQQAIQLWDKELKKIEVNDANEVNKKTFYTALYHCMIHPNVMSDVDKRYRGRDGKIHLSNNNYYTLYSLWDTHRALHPLLNIIDKERSKDFMLSFLAQFEQSGRLPMWELWNNETNCMIGFHSVSVILDAYVKGVIDKKILESLYPAVKAEAMSNRQGLDKFRERGYLQIDDASESVSKTLEYCYDMWCVSEIAKALDKSEDAKYFESFTQAWRNVYDVETGYMRPRKNGDWLKPFNAFEVNNHYTEANAWQYSYFIPHRNEKPSGVQKLFEVESKTTGRTQSDITGLIGQYAHGNEPSHNFAYLLEHPAKQKYIKQILDSLYSPLPDGLCGNDDCGQMSAWYIFSSIGFYPVCPGKTTYEFGIPQFENVRIKLENGKTFSVSNLSKSNVSYPYSIKNSNKSLIQEQALQTLHHKDIIAGTEIAFTNKEHSLIYKKEKDETKLKLVAPVLSSTKQVFKDSIVVNLKMPDRMIDSTYKFYYSFDSASTKNAQLYTNPISISKSTKLYAYVKRFNEVSPYSTATYYKINNQWNVDLKSVYNKQYSADGPNGIIDGLRGNIEWRMGAWQGYQSQDFEAIVDLSKETLIKNISIGMLQDTRSWIIFPRQIEVYSSIDGKTFKLENTIYNTTAADDYTVQVKDFSTKLNNTKARYIKIKAQNYGTLPTWHQGAGGDAFIFTDEIMIE